MQGQASNNTRPSIRRPLNDNLPRPAKDRNEVCTALEVRSERYGLATDLEIRSELARRGAF